MPSVKDMTKKSFTIKIQRPLRSNDPNVGFLIYNEARNVETEVPGLDNLFEDGSLKVYHKALLVPDPKKRGAYKIRIDERVPDENW